MLKKHYSSKIMWGLLVMYVVLFIILDVFYNYFIDAMHSSLSAISIPAIILPYIFLLLLIFWLVKSKQVLPNPRNHKVLFAFGLGGLVMSAVLFTKLSMNEQASHFSQNRWIHDLESRVYMVDDLVANYNLKGMTKQQVTQLLGKQTEPAYFAQDDNVVYRLGMERGFFSIDNERLVLSLDAHNKVADLQILRD
ncbi:amino acid transporter [Paenibacillus shirakamiensis]|uniref:Amino acid transporter n=1 Tax=Paenibacillus shirakamiensis TaxID=1265935 RepID=A0ABS4JGG4_9BACL|nr:hypothetical protein [Paenibacillus shirakamiensis]MBP2000140.1 amino acid transporter [Paenibacillus shirakamiensis]